MRFWFLYCTIRMCSLYGERRLDFTKPSFSLAKSTLRTFVYRAPYYTVHSIYNMNPCGQGDANCLGESKRAVLGILVKRGRSFHGVETSWNFVP